jgi:uncharacterized protein (TIGR02186 family)
VDITTGFDGADLVVFGTQRAKGDVALVLRGPAQRMTVRRKVRVLGIWANKPGVTFDNVPSFYDFAMNRAERDIAPADVLRRHDIGLNSFDFEPLREEDADRVARYREAMIRNQQARGLFPLEPKKIDYVGRDFFRVTFHVPSHVPTGSYVLEAFLIDNGQVIERQRVDMKVAQTGTSAQIYLFAQYQPFIYGLAAVLMALFFGWGAQAVLRRD